MFSVVGIVIDVLLILTVVISAIIGIKKGFLRSVISIFSWGVCLIVAIFTAKYVAGWINGLYNFSGLMSGKISNSLVKLNDYFNQPINSFANKEAIIAGLPANLNGLLKQLIKAVFSTGSVDMASTKTIGVYVGSILADISMVLISGLLVFIVLKIVVALLSKLFDNIEKTKVIGGLNKLLGLLLGLIRAGLIIVIVNCVLVGLTLIPTFNKIIPPLVKNNTYVEKFVYNKTDELFGKYVIEGDTVKNWIEDVWKSR